MKKYLIVLLSLALSACHGEGMLTRDIAPDLEAGYIGGHISEDIRLEFAKSPEDLKRTPRNSLGTFVTNKKTNSYRRKAEKSCPWAFYSAIISLQNRARALGGKAVVNIHSYYKRNPFISPTQYQCYDNYLMSGVALRGTIVK